MIRHLYPGTRGYRIIENYFNSRGKLNRSIFNHLNKNFEPFTRKFYIFYNTLSSQNVDGKKILKYRNLLTDFYCWLALNDIYDFKTIDVNLCLDYIYTLHYASLYSKNDLADFSSALTYYFKIFYYKDFEFDSVIKNLQLYHFNHEFTDIEISSIFHHMENVTLKLLITLILHLGLPMQVLINTRVNDLNLYNQCLTYTGYYSGRRLIYPFDNDLKMKIIKSFVLPENDMLMNSNSSDVSDMEIFYREFSFALLNARLPAKKGRSILKNLHNAVLSGKFRRN
jgi:integrase